MVLLVHFFLLHGRKIAGELTFCGHNQIRFPSNHVHGGVVVRQWACEGQGSHKQSETTRHEGQAKCPS